MDYLVGCMSYIFFCVTKFQFDGVMDMKIREVNEGESLSEGQEGATEKI